MSVKIVSAWAAQAIVTTYFGPTGTKGSRVQAKAQAGTIYVEWDDGLNSYDNHAAAAQEYCRRKHWTGELAHGALPNGSHVFVFLNLPR